MARAKCRWRAKERGALRHAQRGDTGDDTHPGGSRQHLGSPAELQCQNGALIGELPADDARRPTALGG